MYYNKSPSPNCTLNLFQFHPLFRFNRGTLLVLHLFYVFIMFLFLFCFCVVHVWWYLMCCKYCFAKAGHPVKGAREIPLRNREMMLGVLQDSSQNLALDWIIIDFLLDMYLYCMWLVWNSLLARTNCSRFRSTAVCSGCWSYSLYLFRKKQ